MPSPTIRSVIINSTDIHQLALFWANFLDIELDEPDQGASMIWLRSEEAVNLGFQLVDNRTRATEIHLDIEVDDLDVAQQAIESLGGSIVKVNVLATGFEWRVATDPDGNRFCIFTH